MRRKWTWNPSDNFIAACLFIWTMGGVGPAIALGFLVATWAGVAMAVLWYGPPIGVWLYFAVREGLIPAAKRNLPRREWRSSPDAREHYKNSRDRR